MGPKDVIRLNFGLSDLLINSYIGDLEDSELLIRPVPGMNHIAWQLGHLISAERLFIEKVSPGLSPALPEGFAEAHSKEGASSDDPSRFLSKAKYQEVWKAQRAATLAALDAAPEDELDKNDPQRYFDFAPSLAAVLSLCTTHPIMHAGQFVAVRRLLKKPVTI